jgi:hypothetical protein
MFVISRFYVVGVQYRYGDDYAVDHQLSFPER